jgi:predicted Zn-dependent protease
MSAETKSMIAVARRPVDSAVIRRSDDPVIAELDQWRVRSLQAVNEAADAALAELHQAFDQATVARDRVADITRRQQPPRAKPKPTILDAEVALVHELADLVTAATQLHHATLDIERDADVAMVGLVQTAREAERQQRRMMAGRGLPVPPAEDDRLTEDEEAWQQDPDG